MKLRINRWTRLSLALALLAPAAHGAEIELTIAPPNPEWFLPPELSPEPCVPFAGGLRLEQCPEQVMPEGMPEVGEQSLIIDLKPLLAAGNYEAVLARIGLNYGPELLFLEGGDLEGFKQIRTPTDGGRALPPLRDPERPIGQPMDNGEVSEARDVRPARASNVFDDRVACRVCGGLGPGADPISAPILYVIGHSYFSLQRYRPAETAFRLALEAVPGHVRAHESLGMLYLRTERYADARTHLALAVQLGRNTAPVHSALGLVDVKTRRYVAAATDFERALVLAPDDRNAQRGLLLALTETREHDKAAALVEQLLRENPDDRDLWLYRAKIALGANQRSSALASLETALRLGDDSVENRRACFELQMESGNVARGVELLRGFRPRELPFPLVDQALGWLANESEWERFRELLGTVDRATLGGVDQSRLLTRRAALAARDGNRRGANAALQEALELDPSNADALLALARIYHAERDYGRADLLLRRASDYDTVRDEALVARAGVASDQDDFVGALSLLRDVGATSPARADLRRNVDILENLQLLRTRR